LLTNGLSQWKVFVNINLKISGQQKDKKGEERDTIRSFITLIPFSKACLENLKAAEFLGSSRPAWNFYHVCKSK
jgi:hypothetical protein